MNSFIFHYLVFWRPLGYLIIFLGMILEGETLLFITGFLTHGKLFDIGDVLLIAMSGVLIGDLFWYWLGKILDPASFLARRLEKIAVHFDRHLMARPFRTIFISKFAYGLNHALLLRAGALRIRTGDFIVSDFPAAILWVLAVGGLGYFSSASFFLVRHYLRFAELALLLGLIIFILIINLWRISLRSKI